MPPGRKWGGVARRGARNVNPEERDEREERDDRRSRSGTSKRTGGASRDRDRDRRDGGRRSTGGRDDRPRRDRDDRPHRTRDDRPHPQREDRPPRREQREPSPPPPWEPEQWIQEPDEPVRAAAGKAVKRGARGGTKPPAKDRPRRKAPADVSKDIGAAVGRGMSAKVEQKLMEAAKAFERERYRDADRSLKVLVDQAPDVPAVRELYGLNLYRLGRWTSAATPRPKSCGMSSAPPTRPPTS